MSLAAEKREIEQFNKAYRTMNSKTIELRERFYASTVKFHTKRLQNGVDSLHEKREKTTDSYDIKYLDQSIRYAQGQLDKKFTNQLAWISEAKENFDAKITNVSQKLVQFGLTRGHLTVEDTWIESSEMSFLITGEISKWKEDREFLGTVHARCIIVDGPIKATHLRFLTTLRDKPGTIANPIEEKVEVKSTQSKKEQIMTLFNAGKSTKDISMLTGSNISYIRTTIRTNK